MFTDSLESRLLFSRAGLAAPPRHHHRITRPPHFVAAVVQTLTEFRAMAVLDANRYGVQLQWSESDPTVTGYQIERSSDGGVTWQMIAQPTSKQTFYFDFPVPDGTTLSYQIAEVRN